MNKRQLLIASLSLIDITKYVFYLYIKLWKTTCMPTFHEFHFSFSRRKTRHQSPPIYCITCHVNPFLIIALIYTSFSSLNCWNPAQKTVCFITNQPCRCNLYESNEEEMLRQTEIWENVRKYSRLLVLLQCLLNGRWCQGDKRLILFFFVFG